MTKNRDGEGEPGRVHAQDYVSGRGSRLEREHWEKQLQEDEDTFLLYMEALDELQEGLPVLENHAFFADDVMNTWTDLAGASDHKAELMSVSAEPRRTRWYEKAVFHYTVAASLTLLFLSSGVFDHLFTGELKVVMENRKGSPSYSEQMMQTTSGWLNQLMDGRYK